MDFIFSQPLNGASDMLITEAGMVTLVRDLQFLNALLPIFLRPFGNSTEVRFTQPLNTKSSTFVTLSGITTFSNPTQSEKAFSPIMVKFEGKSIDLPN